MGGIGEKKGVWRKCENVWEKIGKCVRKEGVKKALEGKDCRGCVREN